MPPNIKNKSNEGEQGIARAIVAGYKSVDTMQKMEIRPFTVLAGANSSGKSSVMQALLLLKQTVEASYDPGPLLLNGPNVRFSQADQVLSKCSKSSSPKHLQIGVEIVGHGLITTTYKRGADTPFEIDHMEFVEKDKPPIKLRLGMSQEDLRTLVPELTKGLPKIFFEKERAKYKWSVRPDRCFLEVQLGDPDREKFVMMGFAPAGHCENFLRNIIHLPGLRGNPERNYPVTAVGNSFPGTFEKYFASVISEWKKKKQTDKLDHLGQDLERLGLTWKVVATPINDTEVELQVGRLPHPKQGGAHDLVSVADVGLGVSQTLPVIVALHVADERHLVYLEQPEIHLHPKAQLALAKVISEAVNRGVRVVVETHSSLFLRAVQTLIVNGELAKEKCKLHWFQRNDAGSTVITSADLDSNGAFGDWPEDFDETNLNAESRYLDAIDQLGEFKLNG